MFGAPAVDGVTVKATLDGRGRATPDAGNLPRELTPAEITETVDTVTEFFPGLYLNIARTDAFPDLFTKDKNPLLGRRQEGSRIYCATGFSGGGSKGVHRRTATTRNVTTAQRRGSASSGRHSLSS
jgi:sarcosine oxidase